MPRAAWVLLWAGCDGGSDGSDPTDPTSPTDPTVTTVSGAVQSASCGETDNALRFVCTATVDPPASATWTVEDGAGTVRTFVTESAATSDVTVWGLRADTAYTWEVTAGDGAATGTLTTGALPSTLDDLSIDVTGMATVDGIGFPQSCDGSSVMLVVDAVGRVVWYETVGTAGPGGGLSGYDFTDDETVVTAGSEVRELAMDGTELWSLGGFDRPLHHDVTKGGDYVYALNAAEHDGFVVDGLYVLKDGALVAEWDLADHVTVQGVGNASDPFWENQFPGATDWSHANSVWSDGTAAMVSLRWQDAVLSLDGDPLSSTFGAVDWILTGTDLEDVSGDFDWPAGGGFDGQHHATPIDGGVALFDNGASTAMSRALTISLDTTASTAEESASWSMDTHCEVQGAAYPLAGGGMLATCATTGRVAEFAAGDPDPIFDLTAACGASGGGGGPGATFSRGMPVDLP